MPNPPRLIASVDLYTSVVDQIPSASSPNAVHSHTPGGKTPSAQGECPESKSNAPRPRPFHQQISFQWSPIASDSRLSAAKAQGSWTGVARTAARDSTQQHNNANKTRSPSPSG